jgi:valyl-tRNA synthetase
MGLPKRYNPHTAEPRLQAFWQEQGIYHFSPQSNKPVFSIDTPPPTVSGKLHLGHVYSYTHPDLMARFWRMRGYNVFYPMGYDDNGLPTERLVEKRLGVTAPEIGRRAFIQKCIQVSEQAERDYEHLWKRLGLSIDWRYTYRTIDDQPRKIAQLSFIDLYERGLAYRREAPAIWCPECHTAIAQAELDDKSRESEFVTLAFLSQDGEEVKIATTRPELLPACVAVFVHPEDDRYRHLPGKTLTVPLFGQHVPVLKDPQADPEKGTGVVMCCTFGDTTDVSWWYTHDLPLIQAIDRHGMMTQEAGKFEGLSVQEARQEIKGALDEQGLLLDRHPTQQSIRVHERCDTPVEYIVANQWFINILEFKDQLLEAGEKVAWHPPHMKSRYQAWVENLSWDWCISRQRYFGVPFPVWYCQSCGEIHIANEVELPIDPLEVLPSEPCSCGSTDFSPEEDVMDTWATSSLSPQIVGRWLTDESLYQRVFPFSLRPQAHEIIRTWAFYTIVKSEYHFDSLPWNDVLISGWGIAGEGMGKISKSRGGGPMPPVEMIEKYSADAVRYWAASTSPGKDSIISEEKIQTGSKLVTKLWNVARFSQRFLEDYQLPDKGLAPPLTPGDRWILARCQELIHRATDFMEAYDYAAAKAEIEAFFWRELADNYLEMAKQRLYDPANSLHPGALFTLYHLLITILKLLAPFLPHVTEEIYQGVFIEPDSSAPDARSQMTIHIARWPQPDPDLEDAKAIPVGEALIDIATAVRRYKSEHNLSLGAELNELQLIIDQAPLNQAIQEAGIDLKSVTRARQIHFSDRADPRLVCIAAGDGIVVAIRPPEE